MYIAALYIAVLGISILCAVDLLSANRVNNGAPCGWAGLAETTKFSAVERVIRRSEWIGQFSEIRLQDLAVPEDLLSYLRLIAPMRLASCCAGTFDDDFVSLAQDHVLRANQPAPLAFVGVP